MVTGMAGTIGDTIIGAGTIGVGMDIMILIGDGAMAGV
jgi:hypothetical protein